MKKKEVEIYTDGACLGNPGPGGWGALLRMQQKNGQWIEKVLSGAEPDTTNNRMELMAVIEALRALKEPCFIVLTSDSQYVLKGITEWIEGWKRKAWKTASGKPVKNQDLWQDLSIQEQRHEIQWCWVKGHAGHEMNERVDNLAREAAESISVQKRR